MMNNHNQPDNAPESAAVESSLVQLTRWESWIERFWESDYRFSDIARQRLLVHVRTYYPDGEIAPSFVEALLRAVLQRLIDGEVPPFDGNLQGSLQWASTAEPEEEAERHGVMVQIIEGAGGGLLDDYQSTLRRRWEVRPRALDAMANIGRLFLERLENHCASVEALFQPESLAGVQAPELVRRIDELEDGWRQSFEAGGGLPADERLLVDRLTRSALGDWFAGLEDADLATLGDYQQQNLLLQEKAQHLLRDVASLRAYARQCVIDYARSELGSEIEPDELQVKTQSSLAGSTATRNTSLSELVAEGPFAPDEKKVRSAPLTAGFLETLLQTVDPRSSYLEQVRERYEIAELTAILLDLHDVRLLQSAFIAMHRGHLSEAGYQRILAIRDHDDTGAGQPGDKVVNLTLFPDLPLAGLLLFIHEDERQGIDSLVLYAPDKPDGQEWIELPSLRSVAVELGSWLRDEPGRLYLLGQMNAGEQGRAEQFFSKVLERADSWDLSRDHRGAVYGYQACCRNVLALRKLNHLSHIEIHEAPRWFGDLTLAQRQAIAGLNEDLRLCNEAFQRQVAQQETFQAFAKRTVRADTETYLREKGIREAVDPETVLFEFSAGLDDSSPKITRSLLGLAMYGYHDNWGLEHPDMPVRSAVGQDLRTLRAADLATYLRSAYLGDRYVSSLRVQFLEPSAPIYAVRRALRFALNQGTLKRDLHVAHAKGMVDDPSFQQLSRAITQLAEPQAPREAQAADAVASTGGVFRFCINGRQTVGLYVFRFFEGDEVHNWLYMPQAPDGIAFRKYQSFAGAMPGAMHTYILARLRYLDRDAASRRLVLIAKGEEDRDSIREASRISDFIGEYNDYLEAHIDDIEAVTRSRDEVIMEQVLKGLIYAAIPLSLAFPPLGYVLDAVFVLKAAVSAVKAHAEDDDAAAMQHWLGVAVALWGLALPGAWSMVSQLWRSAPKAAGKSTWEQIADPLRPGVRQAQRAGLNMLDERQALKTIPQNLRRLEKDGLWKGVYHRAPTANSEETYYVTQNGRYYTVIHDADNQTLRLVDPRYPRAQYKMPLRQDAWGRWVFNHQVGLRGGGRDTHYLGQVSRVADAFPARANPLPVRGALQGEGVIARFKPEASDNYLYSLNAQSCVVACLYNPASKVGAVIHFDHNIHALLESAVNSAMVHLGRPTRGAPIRATLVGGDWLSGGADIGGPVRSILARKGIQSNWDHWSYSSCLGNIYGVSLDLAQGTTTVFTTTRAAVQEVVDPILREASQGASSALAQRGRRFMTRFRQEPLVQKADGTVSNVRGEVATSEQLDQQALLLTVLKE